MNSKTTPMMNQYGAMKAKYPDAILFFRMGDFYEMFGEDARIAAPILDIVLTSRDRKAEDKTPMCGVPHHAVDAYIAKLIAKNYKVAICEQIEDPKDAKGIVKRDIVRVITPGTLLENNLLEARSNNYLASIARQKGKGGIAFLDMSTGEFTVTEIDLRTGSAEEMANSFTLELNRWMPRELLIPENWKEIIRDDSLRISSIDEWVYSLDFARDQLKGQFHVSGLDGFGLEEMPSAIMAAGALLHYLQSTRIETLKHITQIRVFHHADYVYLDPASRRNLELTRTLMGGQREGSLLAYIDFTITPMGSRLLKQRLEQPLKHVDKINLRLDEIDAFYHHDGCRTDIREILQGISDLERLISRITTGVSNARDMVALRTSLGRLPFLKTLLLKHQHPVFKHISDQIDTVDTIYDLLSHAITDDPPASLREGNLIRPGFNPMLDEIRHAARDGKTWIARLQSHERERTRIPSLKVGFTKVFGYFIEITNSHLHKIPDDYIRRQTLVNAERFVTPELKETEEKILGAEERMVTMEFDLFKDIREQVASQVTRIQKTAHTIAQLDTAAALAELAVRYRYRRPIISDSDRIEIKGGRHPVVERMTSAGTFVPNDVLLDSEENRLIILTGPNMAGKSTYIRQVALITLLAQIGSFVPANEAHIGIVDRIFTRVGASDNLAGGQSTFMVEMSEAANILNNTTARSLVILDEVGRGTSTFDGLSIAWATAEYLHEKKSRTLFATHYHELTDLSERFPGVKNYNVVVKEWNDQVIFLREVVPGGVDRSYGIQVARLAGIPATVLDRAKEVLFALEMKEKERVPDQQSLDRPKPRGGQLELFQLEPSPLIKELQRLKLDTVTPLEALNLLARWKKKYTRDIG